jgi:advillin
VVVVLEASLALSTWGKYQRTGGHSVHCGWHPFVPVAKSLHGKFYTGNNYIILNTTKLKNGARLHDVHYWIGEEDCLLASDNAVELDASVGSHTVQYRETKGEESDTFLSYFKPWVIPIQDHDV